MQSDGCAAGNDAWICGAPEQHKPRIDASTDASRTIRGVSIEFLLTSLVIVAIPGTGVLITLSAAIARGTRAGVVAAFGCTLGIVPHLIAAVTGTAALLRTSGIAFDALRIAGVAYLLFMAVATWRDKSTLKLDADQPSRSAARVIGSAMLSNLLNPKLTVFFFAFLPQFVPAHAPRRRRAAAAAQRRVHGDDVCRVCDLRRCRVGRAHADRRATGRAAAAATGLLGLVRGARREARHDLALTSPAHGAATIVAAARA